MSSIFRFKQFQIDQANCAMKINTDGVLLGGMIKPFPAKRVLDIGTGTGVIAMMLAQKFLRASIDACEIDPAASLQASVNFANSPFSERLQVIPGSFMDMKPIHPYDLIVSNPPFYTNSLRNPDPRRTLAKHADDVFFEALVGFADRYLTPTGQFYCILPSLFAEHVVTSLLPKTKLFYNRGVKVSSFVGGSPIRTILQFGRNSSPLQESDFIIYASKGVYTNDYKELLKPYFLNF